MKKNIILIIGFLVVAFAVLLDFIIIPFTLKLILSWFGFNFSFLQCLIIMLFVYVFNNYLKSR